MKMKDTKGKSSAKGMANPAFMAKAKSKAPPKEGAKGSKKEMPPFMKKGK